MPLPLINFHPLAKWSRMFAQRQVIGGWWLVIGDAARTYHPPFTIHHSLAARLGLGGDITHMGGEV